MEEKTYHFKFAGEIIRAEDCEEDPEEKIFQAIFEENNEDAKANLETKKASKGLAFSLEIKTT